MKLKYVVVLLMLCSVMLSGCVGEAEPEESPVTGTCYLASNMSSYLGVDDYDAPEGYYFILVDMIIRNNTTMTMDTNPNNWILIIDGVEYSAHPATYSDAIDHETVRLRPGAEFATSFVYLVDTDNLQDYDDVRIGYTGPYAQYVNYERMEYEQAA